jgi:hypothetical protein
LEALAWPAFFWLTSVSSSIALINPITLAAAAGRGAFLVAYAKIAQERSVNAQLQESIDLFQKFIDMGKATFLSTDSLRALRTAAGEAALKLGETRKEAEIFGEMVKKASSTGVKPLTGKIRLWATAQDKLNAVVGLQSPFHPAGDCGDGSQHQDYEGRTRTR